MSSEKVIQSLTTSAIKTYKCPKCRDTGWEDFEGPTEKSRAIYGDDRVIKYSAPCTYCNGGQAAKAEHFKKVASIPVSYSNSKLDSFKWDIYQDESGKNVNLAKQKQFVESFVNDFNEWEAQGVGLYIYSHMRGSGKTFLASCICNELIDRYPMKTRFVSASELINIAKSAKEYETDPIELLCNCKLLCIDDLGQKMTGQEWTNDLLFRIMDSRTQQGLVTIITSNLKIAELQLDDRTVDRINSVCMPLPLPECCIRSRAGKQKQIELFKKLGIV